MKIKHLIFLLPLCFLFLGGCQTDQQNSEAGTEQTVPIEQVESPPVNSENTPTLVETNAPQVVPQEFLLTFTLLQNASIEDNLPAFNAYIHPELGCYFIYRPGSHLGFDRIDAFPEGWDKLGFSLEDLYATFRTAELKFEEWPTFVDCGSSGFSKNGTFAKPVEGYSTLTDLYTFNEAEYGPQVSKLEAKQIKSLESMVQYSVIFTGTPLVIDFAQQDGKWYIATINDGRFDCSG